MPYFVVHFLVITDSGVTESNSYGTVPGVLVDAPGSSERITVKNINIHNDSTDDRTIAVYILDNSNERYICITTLSSKDTLIIDDVIVLDSTTETINSLLFPFAGYFAGGETAIGSGVVATTDKLTYSNDITAAQSSANLSQAREGLAGVNNSDISGYFAGGDSGTDNLVVTADKLTYSNDTTTAQSSANLSQARRGVIGVSNSGTAGYCAGGNTGAVVVTADKLVYSNDTTSAQSSANLSQARSFPSGVSNNGTAGYYAGGNTGAVVVTADKLVYSNDTTSAQSSANLSVARYALSGVGYSVTSGYFAGGATTAGGAVTAITDKLTYSNDTTSAQSSANLSQARYGLYGISSTYESAYFAGGSTGAIVSTADKLTYSNDTTAVQSSASLSQNRWLYAGLDG